MNRPSAPPSQAEANQGPSNQAAVEAPCIQLEIVPWLTRLFGKETGGRIRREVAILPDESIGAFLRRIGEEYPEFGRIIWDDAQNDLSEHVQVILNDTVLEAVGPADTKLRPGDQLMLVPPYLGG